MNALNIVRTQTSHNRPLITVELAHKWYGLVQVEPDGRVSAIDFPDMVVEGESSFVDHVPNPVVVIRWAAVHGYYVDPLALELMVGRWLQEVLDECELSDFPIRLHAAREHYYGQVTGWVMA